MVLGVIIRAGASVRIGLSGNAASPVERLAALARDADADMRNSFAINTHF
jgi:hypothetical protein